MAARRVDAVLLTDPSGIVTDKDIATRVIADDLRPEQTVISMVMTRNPIFVTLDSLAIEALQKMVQGDNMFGTSTPDAAESLFGAFGPVMESRLPWAAVIENHNQESTMIHEELMSFISLMDYLVSQTNPSAEDSSDPAKPSLIADIDGFGNYNLEVQGALGSHSANHSVLNLYFLDGGDRPIVEEVRTCGWIKESQLRWFRVVSKDFQVTH